jgi:hypothetical protein
VTAKHLAGAQVLLEAHELITGARQDAYAHPAEDYLRTVNIFRAITGINLTVEEGVLFMLAVKLSRLSKELHDGEDLPDNTRDAVGYLGCLNMVRAARNRKDETWA